MTPLGTVVTDVLSVLESLGQPADGPCHRRSDSSSTPPEAAQMKIISNLLNANWYQSPSRAARQKSRIGVRIAAVPELPTRLLAGFGLAALVVFSRVPSRRRQAT
jgi:hypothetical protein